MFYGDTLIGTSPFVAMVESWQVGERVIAEIEVPALGQVLVSACGVSDKFLNADRFSPCFIEQLNALHANAPIRFVEPAIGGIAIEKTRELSQTERGEVNAPLTEADEVLARTPEPLLMVV